MSGASDCNWGAHGSWLAVWMLALVVLAMSSRTTVGESSSHDEVHVVYMGGKCNKHESEIVADHHQLLASVVGSIEEAQGAILYHYHRSFRGFAAKLAPNHVQALKDSDRVLNIFKSKPHKPATTHSWDFLGVYGPKAVAPGHTETFPSFGNQSDIIIGVFDTGYWPESRSFSDEGLGAPPARWKGQCVPGDNFTQDLCNNKVIGARFYPKGAEAFLGGRIPNDLYSPRDVNGHGTHTASTAAGRSVTNVSYFGIAPGTATGGAPGARIAVYKVCWQESGCFDADVLAAYDDAIADGVDIISFSVGKTTEVDTSFLSDGFALGALHGSLNGILTSAAAGNEGPGPETIANSAPWFLTVAAGTTDRELITSVRLGSGVTLPGRWAISLPFNTQDIPLITSTQAATTGAEAEKAKLCINNTLDGSKYQGKILICSWNYDLPPVEFDSLLGASGVLYVVSGGNRSVAENFPIPTEFGIPGAFVTGENGQTLLHYAQSTSAPVARILQTSAVYGFKPAPAVSSFSSRGPSPRSPDILKPDITAPGVNILAAWSPLGLRTVPDLVNYKFDSGTSMACPHITGIAALIKATHPNWSPAAIKSAIMTTAYALDNTNETIRAYPELESANEYAFGSGHAHPASALDPGLVYDVDPKTYLDFLCGFENATTLTAVFQTTQGLDDQVVSCPEKPLQPFNLNYPSISLTNLTKHEVVTRVVTNVGPHGRVTYRAHVSAPRGVHISVHPKKLRFQEVGQRLAFRIKFNVLVPTNGSHILRGSITWTDGQAGHSVRSPILIKTVPLGETS